MRTRTQLEIVVTTVIVVMIFGTIAYHNLEKWNYVDSFYFTGITVTTIGYGDMYPTTPLAKIFTVFFAFAGVGLMLFALSMFATTYFERRERKLGIGLEQRFLKDITKSVKSVNGSKKKRRDLIRGSKI